MFSLLPSIATILSSIKRSASDYLDFFLEKLALIYNMYMYYCIPVLSYNDRLSKWQSWFLKRYISNRVGLNPFYTIFKLSKMCRSICAKLLLKPSGCYGYGSYISYAWLNFVFGMHKTGSEIGIETHAHWAIRQAGLNSPNFSVVGLFTFNHP